MGEQHLTRRAEPFSLLTYDFPRIPSIMEERAGTYAAYVASACDRALLAAAAAKVVAQNRDEILELLATPLERPATR